MELHDDCLAWCGDCGEELPPLTPWKSNPCENPACPSQLDRVAAMLWNLSNDLTGAQQDTVRRLAADLRSIAVEDTGRRLSRETDHQPGDD